MSGPKRNVVVLKQLEPVHGFYVLASEDEEFYGELSLGHVTAGDSEDAARVYDDEYENHSTYRAVIPEEAIVWCRMASPDRGTQ